jgi:hypothetical protein
MTKTDYDPFDLSGMTQDFIKRSMEGYCDLPKASQKEFLRQVLAYHSFFEQMEKTSSAWGVGVTEFFDKMNKMKEIFS